MRFPKTPQRARTSRRQLFSGRSDHSTRNRLSRFLDEHLEPRILCSGRTAMACDFQIRICSTNRHRLGQVGQAFDLIDDLEEQMSAYRPSSEISRINASAFPSPFPVETRLLGLLREAGRLSRETGGAFDITSAPFGKLWGFFDRQGRIPAADEIAAVQSAIGSHLVEIDSEKGTLCFRHPDVQINLGAIGKGYALDRAVDLLRRRGLDSALLHAGFSTIVGFGDSPDGSSPGWAVGVRHPLQPNRDFAILRLVNGALSTSGLKEQGFVVEGERLGHIVDPRTGFPARGRLLACAVAPTGTQADALSTAFFVMDSQQIQGYCERHPEVGALLVEPAAHADDGLCYQALGSIGETLEVLV